MENNNPLVSICIPVFNGGSLIHRALLSAIHQTYKNIEIVVSDNASTDDTEKVVMGYATEDNRIRYVRSGENRGSARNFAKSLELAHGEYVQLLAHDDWLSKNYIEEGIKSFNQNPDTASVFPFCLGLTLHEDGELRPGPEVKFRNKNYSKNYFLKNIYRNQIGSVSIYSVLRKKDAVEAALYAINVFNNPPSYISQEFQSLGKEGYGIDIVFFLKIFLKYNYFTLDNEAVYIKVGHKSNAAHQIPMDISKNTAISVFKDYSYLRICLEYIYSTEYKDYLTGLRVFFGTEYIGTLLFNFIKHSFPQSYFKNFSWESFISYFHDYTYIEKAGVILFLIPALLARIIRFVWRRLSTLLSIRKRDIIFSDNLFLDSAGNFKV